MMAGLPWVMVTLFHCVSWSHGFSLQQPSQKQQLGQFEPLDINDAVDRTVRWVDCSHALTDFEQAWDYQKQILQQHIDTLGDTESFHSCNSILFVQHHPVYTLGTASTPDHILDPAAPIPVVRMNRGGEVTYHGPGQLVIYPVLNLRQFSQDIHWYVRALEQVVIQALHSLGIAAYREPDITGIWVDGAKVAAVGVKCQRWITQHGVAINVERTALDNFRHIRPCGLDREVGCLQDSQPHLTMADVIPHVKVALEQVFEVSLEQCTLDAALVKRE